MQLTAAETIAAHAPEGELVPNPLDVRVHAAVRDAVAAKAREQGVASMAKLL